MEFTNAEYQSPSGQGIEGGTWSSRDFIDQISDDVIHAGGATGVGFGDAFNVTGEVVAIWIDSSDMMWVEQDREEVVDSDLFLDEPPTPSEYPKDTSTSDGSDGSNETKSPIWAYITGNGAGVTSYEMIVKPSADGLAVKFTDAGYESPSGQGIEGGTWSSRDFIDQISDDVIHAGGATGGGYGDAFDVTGEVVAIWIEDSDAMWVERGGTEVVDSDLFLDEPPNPNEWTDDSTSSSETAPDFTETFGSGTGAFDSGWRMDTMTAVTSPTAPSGNDAALQTTTQSGAHVGGHGYIEMDRAVGYQPEELHQRYWVYFGENTNPQDDCKAPGFSGDPNRNLSGTTAPDGYNGWSARGSYHAASGGIEPGFYVYHVDQPDWWGTYERWGVTLNRSQWYQIDQYIDLNTPGENDGVLKGWVDGEEVYSRSNWRWRDTSDLPVHAFWHDFYHGGNATASNTYSIYTDEYQCWAEQGQIL
ncbi:polysaccharide lyase [Natrinema amylolyticum]|uniref:polysaccharide lyase n=1 Tax=Natrinema amylolyticum TaxID=2878679 RepID=UPI001CF97AC6|nr:hypothetical protein [Natrinema amylolyticum]